jgi:para-nitrobenzyl esterase
MALERVGVGLDRSKFEAVEVGQLIEAEVALRGSGLLGMGGRRFSPVLGPSLPEHPELALQHGAAAGIPIVTGCTTDEMLAFLIGDPEFGSMSEQGLRERLGVLLGDYTEPVLAGYKSIHPDESPTSLLVEIMTDAMMRMPHIRSSEAMLHADEAPVWMYVFAWGFPDASGRKWSAHGTDMPYFFDNVDKASIAAGPHAAQLVEDTSGALVSLAYTGDPNHGELPQWPTYGLGDRFTMRFDTPSSVASDPFRAERLCWDGIPLDGLLMGDRSA